MKLIIINGSSCSGKSTVIDRIMKERDDLFRLSRDSIKWFFSKHKSGKRHEDIQKLILSIADSVFKMKYDVISDSTLYSKKDRKRMIDLAKERGYEVKEVNLEADYEVLLKRFRKRIEGLSKDPEKNKKTSNFSEDRFREIFEIYEREKNPQAIILRTDKQDLEEVFENIINLF